MAPLFRPARALQAIIPALSLVVATACTTVPIASTSSPPASPTARPTAPPSSTPTRTAPSASTATAPTRGTPSASPPIAGVEVARADVARVQGTPAEARSAATAVNALTIDLHRLLAAGDTNTVFSGASVATALGMARSGARAETAAQMDDVLDRLAADDNPNWINSLDQVLAARSGTFSAGDGRDHELVLDIANAWFAQRDVRFEPAFLDTLARRYGAGMHLVDYVADAEAARQVINAWAAERTRDRIPEALLPGDVTAATRFALVNAIYLKAPWRHPFEEADTGPGTFRTADGSSVEVPMMRATMPARCAAGNGWTAAELPYIGDQLAMLLVVPADLAAFEADLDAARLDAIADALESDGNADVALPAFDIESRANLADALAALGMPAAFDPGRADFSGITGEIALYISKVIHQANISVDEAGTEAAAVTVVVGDTSGPPPTTCTLTADRPFLFAVRDLETGAILFMGRLVDPS